ncbi:MAG: SDR family oxidoreductase [Phormidesmis sp.]
MTSSQRKTALVTGGNKGIGFAICEGLLAAGFDVFLAARRSEAGQQAIKKLSNERSDAAGYVELVELDITDDRAIQAAVAQIEKHKDSLDVLINNAGIYPDEGVDILTVSRELLNLAMTTNTFGSIGVTQAFVPLLEKSASPRVINMSSGNGQLEGISASVPSYSLSKMALNGATILLSRALKPKNIAVYAMCPGWVRTDMGGEAAPRSPQEGADTAIWLATEATMADSGKFFRDRTAQPY